MSARKLGVALACTMALWTLSATAHSGIPQKWWLDEKTTVTRLRAVVKQRYVPSAWQGFSGRCRGLVPRATRAGVRVYKHFACTSRIRLNGVNFSFFYRVHVTGPRGRITLGG